MTYDLKQYLDHQYWPTNYIYKGFRKRGKKTEEYGKEATQSRNGLIKMS